MLEKLLKSSELKLSIKNFVKKNSMIWDVAIYGSSVRGKEDTRDIDFAILLSDRVDVGKKLSLCQQLKEMLENILPAMQVDVKIADMNDFLDPNFLARQGIISEGYLILRKKYIAHMLGFKTFVLMKYSLKGLTPSQKKMLYYALKGRREGRGVLDGVQGELLSNELLKIPIQASYKIEQLLKLHKVGFTTEFVMSYKKRY